MKNKALIIIIILLAVTSSVGFVSAENTTAELRSINVEENRIGEKVKSEDDGYLNIRFNDSYNGYCINKGLVEAKVNDTFEVHDTTYAVSNRDDSQIGNYLKLLFVDNHETVTTDYRTTQNIIWTFSNFDYKNSDNMIIQNILNNPREIKDHGTAVKINDTTEAVFDFEVLKTGNSKNQNFFGYKITYRNIESILNETLGSSENDSFRNEDPGFEIPENDTSQKIENSTEENGTLEEMETAIPENTTEEMETSIPENRSEDVNKIAENESSNATSDVKNIPSGIGSATGNPLFVLLLALISVGILKSRKMK